MTDTKFTPGPWSWRTSNSWRRLGSDSTGKDADVLYPTTDRHDNHPNLDFPNGGFDGPDARLIAAAPEMFAKLDKIARWLESLAVISEKQIETCRFESLNDAYRADAKNYAATARDIRAILAKAVNRV